MASVAMVSPPLIKLTSHIKTVTTSTTIQSTHCSVSRLTDKTCATTETTVLMLSINGRLPPIHLRTKP